MKKSLLLAFAALMTGTMVAQDKVISMADYKDAIGTTYVKTQKDFVVGSDTITLTPDAAGNGYKMQNDSTVIFGKNGATLVLPFVEYPVSKIVVQGAASGASGKVTFNIFAGDNAASTEVTGANGTHEFLIAENYQNAAKFTIKNTNANNNQIVRISIYKAVAGAPKAPTFSVASGTYTTAQTVALACETEGAEIRYTLDGSEPTVTSTLYTAPIAVAQTTTIKAIAVKAGAPSALVSATYTIVSTLGEGTKDTPYTLADVKKLNNNGNTGVWVVGTIIGCYVNNAPCTDISKAVVSNLALAAGNDTIPVALPDGEIRKALNIVDHKSNVGKEVKICGDLQSYYSTTGLKNPSDFEIVGDAHLNNTAADKKNTLRKVVMDGKVMIIRNGKIYNLLGQEVK